MHCIVNINPGDPRAGLFYGSHLSVNVNYMCPRFWGPSAKTKARKARAPRSRRVDDA